MTPEERYEFLLTTSKRVLKAFRDGQNPTFRQLEKLETAIACVELQKICGHRHVDGDCDCVEINEVRHAD